MDLLNASRNGNLKEVRELLVNGADPNIVDTYNTTPLGWTSTEDN